MWENPSLNGKRRWPMVTAVLGLVFRTALYHMPWSSVLSWLTVMLWAPVVHSWSMRADTKMPSWVPVTILGHEEVPAARARGCRQKILV